MFGFGYGLNSGAEFDSLNDFRQLVLISQFSPSFGRRHHLRVLTTSSVLMG
jgi:hypothetical protein